MSTKEQLDDIKDAGVLESVPVEDSTVPMPESLRSLSDAELRAMEKRIVRKADLVLMWVVFLLNGSGADLKADPGYSIHPELC